MKKAFQKKYHLRKNVMRQDVYKRQVDGMGDIVVTNDGATILKEMDIEHCLLYTSRCV